MATWDGVRHAIKVTTDLLPIPHHGCRQYIDYDYIHMIPDGWYPIGSDNGDMLFIDSNQCHGRASNYLYWTELLFVDSAIEIEMNVERWLERLIICNGAHFWELKGKYFFDRFCHWLLNLWRAVR